MAGSTAGRGDYFQIGCGASFLRRQQETQKGCSVIAVVLRKQIAVGQEVSLGGENPDWLLVDGAEGKTLHLLRTFGEPAHHSAGFWIDGMLIRAARWPLD